MGTTPSAGSSATMATTKWRALWAIVPLVLCSGAGASRETALALSGRELLIDAQRVTAGPEPAGIYAVDQRGAARCVLPLGSCPRWSPSRERLACLRDGQLQVLVRRTGELAEIPLLPGCCRQPLGLFAVLMQHALAWVPNENHVVVWRNEIDSREQAVTRRAVCWHTDPLSYPAGYDLVEGRWSVGRITFHPRSRRLAYEAYEARPDVGALHGKVLVRAVDSDEATPLALPLAAGETLLNPLWCPVDERLALDSILPDGRRRTLVVAPDGRSAAEIPSAWPKHNWSQVCAWSPDGTRLLLASGEFGGMSRLGVYVAEVAPGGPRKPDWHALNRRGYVHAACWSPDGTQVAILEGDAPNLEADGDAAVAVQTPGTGAPTQVRLPSHLRAVGIEW